MTFPAPDADSLNARYMSVVARLAPGVPVERARSELNVIHARMQQQFPVMNTGFVTNVAPLHDEIAGELKQPLFVLFAAVVGVPCDAPSGSQTCSHRPDHGALVHP